MSTVVPIRGFNEAKRPARELRSRMETLLLNEEIFNRWLAPPFQRELKVTQRVREAACEIEHNGGVIPGIITLGHLKSEPVRVYLLDGQHRIAAAHITKLKEFIGDVRVCEFDSMAEMGEEFVRLNSKLRTMVPDDILRALEGSSAPLRALHSRCEFIGYSNVRRGDKATTLLSMSCTLRCWVGSKKDTPQISGSGSVIDIVDTLTMADMEELSVFLLAAKSAWGNDVAYFRLWGNLNLAMCMWLWRQIVLSPKQAQQRRVTLSPDQFQKCMMSVSANSQYLDWLVGRSLSERDRNPCYNKLKAIFATRIREISRSNTTPKFPQPSWAA